MELKKSVCAHLLEYGNTPVGEILWGKHKDEILEYLKERGIEVTVKRIEKKASGWYDAQPLEPFFILERVKK